MIDTKKITLAIYIAVSGLIIGLILNNNSWGIIISAILICLGVTITLSEIFDKENKE